MLFHHRMKNCEGDITTLHSKAFEIYRYFQDARDDKMYAPICAYIDTPVNADLAGKLTEN